MTIEETNIKAFLTGLLTPIIKDVIKEMVISVSPLLPKEPPSERYIDTKETRHILGDVSNVTIWDWEKKKILQSYRIGNLKRFKLSEVLASPKAIQRTKNR